LDRKGEGVRILLDANEFPLGTIKNDAIMGEHCECFHSKLASMLSNPLVDIMM
jgi:hypothetical protein